MESIYDLVKRFYSDVRLWTEGLFENFLSSSRTIDAQNKHRSKWWHKLDFTIRVRVWETGTDGKGRGMRLMNGIDCVKQSWIWNIWHEWYLPVQRPYRFFRFLASNDEKKRLHNGPECLYGTGATTHNDSHHGFSLSSLVHGMVEFPSWCWKIDIATTTCTHSVLRFPFFYKNGWHQILQIIYVFPLNHMKRRNSRHQWHVSIERNSSPACSFFLFDSLS